jgi:oligopeptidase B
MGRSWYEDGKFLKKRNTFTDFIAAAEELVRSGVTRPDMLVAEGRSAGGLLMGAVANLNPDLFAVIVAGVPFVDVVTTMLDESIPLTSLEWEEWGNPGDPTYYAYMKSYSPYDNVTAKAYPHIVVTTGLNDPRVGYFEPAKWVQRLRELKTDDRDVILKIHMGAGHGGSSGRYDRLAELAMQYAFALNRIGITV